MVLLCTLIPRRPIPWGPGKGARACSLHSRVLWAYKEVLAKLCQEGWYVDSEAPELQLPPPGEVREVRGALELVSSLVK